MKKALTAGLLACSMMLAPAFATYADEKKPNEGSNSELAPSARSAILLDAETGTIIYEKNSHDKLPPASITKIMTMLLTMEALEDGRLKLTDKVRTSERAASMGGSQIFLEPGEEMTVDDMLKGIAMASGNDASVALAERIAGSEEEFVKMMNERAAELGMKNTHFSNCNGLPVENHYSTAHDIALMSRELLKHEKITKYTGLYQDYLRKDTPKPFWLVNTNKLVRFYPGADGLKTGYTSEAKFCLSATASRDGLRTVAVVLGAPDTKNRNNEISRMFDYGFAQYSKHSIYKKGEVLGSIQVSKGAVPSIQLQADQNYSVLVKKGGKAAVLRHEVSIPKSIKAPVTAGQIVGKLTVYQGEQLVKEFDLKAPEDVKRAGWWKLFKRTTGKLFHVD
ncbi:D-alanyl-D-alanine carboxypeptidase family protein [Paenibacillus dakarensis]|uniref:D-alanyl-D-alanine carboxypeptidase family protein n=1 Tax=Paenibacillus dakarensis TaxID=1527293 RepID=UPI0006D5707D|nr:D-alanyl-D-alanine carboxypeptidase family protein [Paenibacillus dakarensis]